jgi:glutathione peroxidase
MDLYRYLKVSSSLYDQKKKRVKDIPWNFAKFLVSLNENGHQTKVEFFEPRMEPSKIIPKIEEALKQE